MLKFKEFILEYLTPEQEKEWSQVKMEPEARKATDHFFGEGNDHVREDIKNYDHDKSEIHRKVEAHLGKELSHEEYKSGLTNDKYGRQVKLGKLIKDDKLKTEYSNDSSRVGGKLKQPYMTIVRGHHVAGQTNPEPDALHPTGHAWEDESCKNINTGCNKHYLSREIKHGSVVVRGHDADGKEIYRATLQPHIHESGAHMYALNSEYGIKHPSFTAHSRDVADRLSGEYKPGPYRINQHVYNDLGTSTQIHPGASSEDLTKLLDNADKKGSWANSSDAYEHVLNSRNVTPEHIDRMISHKNSRVRELAAESPKASNEHITKALNDDATNVRRGAVRNPNITQEHIKKVLEDKDEHYSIAANAGKKAKGDNINLALNHPNSEVCFRTIRGNPNITADHLTHVLKTDPSDENKRAALNNAKANPSHINIALDDKDEGVAEFAATHEKASDENLTKAMSHPSWHIVNRALELNPNIKAHHIEQALKHKSTFVRAGAAGHKNINPTTLTKLLDDPSAAVRHDAVRNPSINDSHKDKILTHSDPNVRERGFARHKFDLSSEELHKGLSDPDDTVRAATIQHQNIKPEHINKALDDTNEIVKLNAMQHKNVDSSNIDKMFKEPDLELKRGALYQNRNKLTSDHLDKMIADPDLVDLAAKSEGLKPKHISKIIRTGNGASVATIIQKHAEKLTHSHINSILNNSEFDEYVKRNAMHYGNPSHANYMTALHPDQHILVKKHALQQLIDQDRMKPEFADLALKSKETTMHWKAAPYAHTHEQLDDLLHPSMHPVVREAALQSKHVTSDQLGKVLNEPKQPEHEDVYEAAAGHRNLQPHQIEQMLTRPYEAHLHAAMRNRTAVTPNVINMALNGDHEDLARHAAQHPNASSENLHRAVLDPRESVATAALENRNITQEHLTSALNHHPHNFVKNTARTKLIRMGVKY